MEKLRTDLESESKLALAIPHVPAPTHASATGRSQRVAAEFSESAEAIIRVAEALGLADMPESAEEPEAGNLATTFWPPLPEMAARARMFVGDDDDDDDKAAENPNWTQPRPKNSRTAQNIFVCELTDFQFDRYGAASHAMTSAIVEKLFPGEGRDGRNGREYVERLTRERKNKSR